MCEIIRERRMTSEELRNAILTELTVPVWPHAGKALGVSRNSSYEAARRNEIPTVKIGNRLSVPTARLREMLGLEGGSGEAGEKEKPASRCSKGRPASSPPERKPAREGG
jgi:hypothetical protein